MAPLTDTSASEIGQAQCRHRCRIDPNTLPIQSQYVPSPDFTNYHGQGVCGEVFNKVLSEICCGGLGSGLKFGGAPMRPL